MRGAALLVAGVVGFMGAADLEAARAQVLDPRGEQVDALRGVLTWSRADEGRSVLMRRVDGRTSRIPGTLAGLNLREPDLGVDRSGRVVLVYGRCTGGRCQGPFVADVRRGGSAASNCPAGRVASRA